MARFALTIYPYSLLLLLAVDLAAAPLFEDNSVLEVTLRGSIGSVFADTEDRREHPFVLSTEGIEHQVKVRLRGHSRLRVCEFPPLRLNFRKEDRGCKPEPPKILSENMTV